MRLFSFPTCFVVLALLCTGCGGSKPKSASSQVRAMVNRFTVEIGRSNYRSACKLTTGEMASNCRSLTARTEISCVGAAAGTDLGNYCGAVQRLKSLLNSLTGATITKLVITGATGTVVLRNPNEVVDVQRVGGVWRIAKA